MDIAGTTGDSKQVEWYLNPGDDSGEWTAYPVGTFDEALYPDRTETADLNGDGRLDVIVTEENGEDSDAQSFWWEQTADPTSNNWIRHLITTQATTNSLDVADMDRDGDTDIILAEHRGSKKLAIWANDGKGNFTEQVVDTGKESHLGAQTVDLDGDGDLDIVSIGWDEPQFIHVWRNDELGQSSTVSAVPAEAVSIEPNPVPPEAISPPKFDTSQTEAVARDGLVALYAFNEGTGNIVHDVSGVGEPLDLIAADVAALEWLPSGGLMITAPTILTSAQPAQKVIDAYLTTNELTIEAWIKPDGKEQEGPARIITVSFDPFNRNITLGQEFGAYEMRLRTSETSENGVPSLATPDGVVEVAIAHLVYTRDVAGQAIIYHNGKVVAKGQISGNLSAWDDRFKLALANEMSLDRPWLGVYYQVAFYDRTLTEDEIVSYYHFGLNTPLPESVVESVAESVTEAANSIPTSAPQLETAQSPTSISSIPWLLIASVLLTIAIVVIVAMNRRNKQSS